MNSTEMTPEMIDTIPNEDIAVWRTKVHRVKWALRQQTQVTPEDGQVAWILADPRPYEPTPGYWSDPEQRNGAYEATMMYELDKNMSLGGLKKALELPNRVHIDVSTPPEMPEVSKPDKWKSERAHLIGQQALLDGFVRLGMVVLDEDGTKTAPPSLTAALMYERAEIKEATDRRLYERSGGIDSLTAHIARATVPRTVELQFRSGDTATMPVYRALSFGPDDGPGIGEDGFNLTAPTFYGKWWQELGQDFARIEAVELQSAQESCGE